MKEDLDLQNILLHQNSLVEARRWQIATIVSVGINILLVLAILFLTPLKTTEIKYVEFAKAGTYHFKVLPTPLAKKQKLLLIRHFLRNYVIRRISYTGSADLDRPNVLSVVSMSKRLVAAQYQESYKRIQEEASFDRRDVEIILDIPTGKGAHRVEFKTIDWHRGKSYENTWAAQIAYDFEKQFVNEENEYLNPLGLVVTKFFHEKKKLTNEDLNEILR